MSTVTNQHMPMRAIRLGLMVSAAGLVLGTAGCALDEPASSYGASSGYGAATAPRGEQSAPVVKQTGTPRETA